VALIVVARLKLIAYFCATTYGFGLQLTYRGFVVGAWRAAAALRSPIQVSLFVSLFGSVRTALHHEESLAAFPQRGNARRYQKNVSADLISFRR